MNNRKRKTLAPQNPVCIFQIHFREDQRQSLDPAFEPFDNTGAVDERLEFGVFDRLSVDPKTKGLKAWGAVSWRFGEKTGLTGQALLETVAANPGVDVFYMNALPINEALFDSGWMQGEISHPGLTRLAAEVLRAAGYSKAVVYELEASAMASSANYFVGTPAFWRAYVPFVKSVLEAADQQLPIDMKRLLHSNADPKGMHHGATYVPFIVERLFPLFLKTAGRHLLTHKVNVPTRERALNVHLKILRSLKEQAIQGRSPWMLKVWRNYRNLYLQQTATPTWCNKHLPMMNSALWETYDS